MKRILAFATLVASTFTAFSQSLGYTDLGILFSNDNNYGTARFEAMSGAFGALGSDPSSISINPAGGAVATKSIFAASLGNRNTQIQTTYYGNTHNSDDSYLNITQAGGSLVFDTDQDSDWNRFALSFNYRLKSDFEETVNFNGNSNFLFYDKHLQDNPNNPVTVFDRSLNQNYNRLRNGQSTEMSFGFSTVHQNNLFLGASLKFHDIELFQETSFEETNDDINGNILRATNYLKNVISGTGISLNLGFIYKLNQNLRFGLSYETPTWYNEIIEEYTDNLYMDKVDDLGFKVTEDLTDGVASFRFKTPSRLTASGAFIFGKQGLISIDYTYKDYTNTKYRENDKIFVETNNNFSTQFRDTHSLNIGTEWRFDKMSIRGGYHYEKNPNLLAALGGNTNKDNLKGFSLGLGYNFGNTKFDLAYRKSESINYNSLYNLGDITLNNNTTRITGTITFSL